VTFTNTTTGQVTSWAWNFGDGTTSTAKSPTHSYSQNGIYTVILTATGSGGAASKTATNAIAVGASSSTGLVAAYGFDEGTGTTVKDRSPYGNTGTISSATWVTTGRFGRALSFNGSSSWITVNDANSLDLTTGMTIEAWVYPIALSGWRSVIMKESTNDEVYSLYANVPQVAIVTSEGLVNVSTSSLPLNRWTHLAGTYDGATQRLYVNGVQVASKSRTGAMAASTRPLRIGGDSLWGEYFQGLIDEVRIYNRALTATQIQADMNTAVSTNP
jgi:PKD repeat protein